jgi:hypothetical protein
MGLEWGKVTEEVVECPAGKRLKTKESGRPEANTLGPASQAGISPTEVATPRIAGCGEYHPVAGFLP